jgi:hypothetical protein
MSQPQLQRSHTAPTGYVQGYVEGCAITQQAPGDLRSCVELRTIDPLMSSSMPCTRRTVSAVQRRPAEATHVRSYPTVPPRGAEPPAQDINRPMRPAPSLAVPSQLNDREWLRCWLHQAAPSYLSASRRARGAVIGRCDAGARCARDRAVDRAAVDQQEDVVTMRRRPVVAGCPPPIASCGAV